MTWWKTRVPMGDGVVSTYGTYETYTGALGSLTSVKSAIGEPVVLEEFDPNTVPTDPDQAKAWREEMLHHITADGMVGIVEEVLDLADMHVHDDECGTDEDLCFTKTFYEVFDSHARLRHTRQGRWE